MRVPETMPVLVKREDLEHLLGILEDKDGSHAHKAGYARFCVEWWLQGKIVTSTKEGDA